MKLPVAATLIVVVGLASAPAHAHMPAQCAETLEALEKRAEKAENELYRVNISFKNGYSKSRTHTMARALIAELGRYVTATGELSRAYGTFMTCIGAGGAIFQGLSGVPERGGYTE